MKKKLLTFEDLEKFYSKYKRSVKFSSEKSGYQLAVQVPAVLTTFEENNDDTVGFYLVKCFHVGTNRNKSNVTLEAAQKAMKTMAYKPILANFCELELDDGTTVRDFTSHDMEVTKDGITYIEKQVGCFTVDEPYIEHDDELNKDYVWAYCAIPREYTDANEIIERKQGTDVSVELLINELSYNAVDKVMELTDVTVQGLTLLGCNPETGAKVEPGMYDAKLTIQDFAKQNNSLFTSMSEEENSKLIETLERLNTTLSSLNIDNKNTEGGLKVENFEEKEEIVETPEDGTEETTEEFTEVTETEAKDDDETKETEAKDEDEETEETEDYKKKRCEEESDNTETTETTESEEEITEEVPTETEKFTKTFAISHEDIRSSLYALLASYEEMNNDCYFILKTFDSYFVYQGWMGDCYGQKYTKSEEGAVSFDGEPYALYAEFVTKEEQSKLEEMRANYSSIVTELNAYKEAEEMNDKMTVFEDVAYANYLETKEFKSLMSEENVKKFTKEELAEKADATLGKLVKAQGTFAYKGTKEEVKAKPSFFAYAKRETESSFLDGLLKK